MNGMIRLAIIMFFWAGIFVLSAQIPAVENEITIEQTDSMSVDSVRATEIYSKEEAPEIEENEEEIEIEYPEYDVWEKVSLQGKLKMQGLPLSPSVKIFMEKDSLIDLSLRAPFVGEAGRMIVTPDSVTVVNKMNKTYVKEGIAEFLQYYPGGLGDLQNLFLARFFLPGFDVNTAELDELIDIYYEDNQFNVVPKGAAEIEGVKYGFVVDESFRPLMLVVLPETRGDIEIDAFYKYKLQGYDMQIVYQEGEQSRDLVLELKEPEWGGEAPKGIDTGKKYRKLGFGEFLRAF